MAETKDRKAAIVTGASSGIGLETARALLDAGMYVIGIGRSKEKCELATQELTGCVRDPAAAKRIDFIIADLSSQREVREAARAATELLQEKSGSRLDVLINNAGTVASRRIETEDGCELQWAVNHLAPFLFSHQMLPYLLKGHEARIITVSSQSHRGARIHWKDPNLRRGYNPLRAYKQSKLANVLFTCQLNRLLGPESSLRAFAADPGLVRTEIGYKNTTGISRLIWSLRRTAAAPPAEGAATSVFLATTPRDVLEGGCYWRNCRPAAPSRYARSDEAAERLWRISEEMCAVAYDDFLPISAASADRIIRQADTETELEIIRTLFREYVKELGDNLDFQGFEEELDHLPGEYSQPHGSLFLAWVEGVPAGCIALRQIDGSTCEMKRLFVRPRYRSLKIGRTLVETIVADARSRGYRTMKLDTLERLQAAYHLYRSFGFRDTAPYTYNPLPGAVFMELEL